MPTQPTSVSPLAKRSRRRGIANLLDLGDIDPLKVVDHRRELGDILKPASQLVGDSTEECTRATEGWCCDTRVRLRSEDDVSATYLPFHRRT
mgnify:CR=1